MFSFTSDRGCTFDQWSIVRTYKQSSASIRLCYLAHALCYHAIACLNGLGSLDSPGSAVIVACLHHSLLTLSFEPPCFNQNLCSQCYDTPGPGPISPSPLCLCLTEVRSGTSLMTAHFRKHHSYYAPRPSEGP